MKNTIKNLFMAVVLLTATVAVSAQQVNTLYFLENAPTRHYINPAFQPISKVYVSLPVIGWTSFYAGNNSFALNNVVYNKDGKTITPLYPGEDRSKFLKKIRKNTLLEADMQVNLLSFGFRIKEAGYFHFTLNERADFGFGMPRDMFTLLLDGGMKDLTGGNNSFNFRSLGVNGYLYTELGLGYSHKINDKWTVGGKIKLLAGQAYVGVYNKKLDLDASTDDWALRGEGTIRMAAPANMDVLPNQMTYDDIKNIDMGDFIDTENPLKLLKPAGWGAALDLGATYQPAKWVQLSAGVTDLGFIHWNKGVSYKYNMDLNYNGIGEINYEDYVEQQPDGSDKFNSDRLIDTITTRLEETLDGVTSDPRKNGFTNMVSAKLNVGADFQFWENRVGVGIYSRTKFFNHKVYEEVTLGAAFRPVHWFNLALSHSFVNGNWASMGVGLGLVTYEGLGLTLAMDYVPLSWVKTSDNIPLPYKAKGVNLAMGLNIVIGHKSDKDKDGVKDAKDLCPKTPKKVKVDEYGCPLDSDGDGVPDYLDQCPNTPESAYGYVDEHGCPLDSDGDGVPDYLDQCPNTPEAAWGMVDENGCALDSDGDGVPDYKDECPDTPAEARGFVDEKGCLLDTDGDGVPDYLDECPDTPAEARGSVDEKGCPIDSDGDGVPDYLDECPDTKPEEWGHVDEKGCALDTDGDGVPDFCDECPTVAGVKDNKGCPQISKEVKNLLKKALQGIQFETGKANIKKASYPILNQIANTFIDNPTWKVEVQGHTDNVGKPDFNMGLSDRRANAVRNYLIEAGVPATQMTSHGYGDTMPVADNKTAAGRAKNRRVEFVITFEEVTHELINDRVPEQANDSNAAPAAEAQPAANAQ